MELALLLHFHQPPTQFSKITQEITRSCYVPLFELVSRHRDASFTFNVTGSLFEQWQGCDIGRQAIKLLEFLVESGQVEITGTGCYHPLLSKLPIFEVRRQIELQENMIQKLGLREDLLEGFFPPELAVNEKLALEAARRKYQWILVDEAAFGFGREPGIYVHKSGLSVVVRDDTISGVLAFGKVKTSSDLVDLLHLSHRSFYVLAMDGETFGHHMKNGLALFQEIISDRRLTLRKVTDLVSREKDGRSGRIKESTWGTTEEDLLKKLVYTRWDLPKNDLHRVQWELLGLAIRVVRRSSTFGGLHFREARELLDKAEHSDQFWWASANPCWHPDMVRRGAEMLKGVAFACRSSTVSEKKRAEWLFNELVRLGKERFGEKAIFC